MNALIIGGMSPRHKEWVRQVAKALQPRCDEVRFLDYAHWDKEGAEMDLESEVQQAAELAEGLSEYVVVAKSIGTVVTALAHKRGLLTPERCVLLGFPLKVVHELSQADELATAVEGLPPTAFVHNDNDPIGTAERLREYVSAHAPATYTLEATPGDTHDYVDFDQMVRLASL